MLRCVFTHNIALCSVYNVHVTFKTMRLLEEKIADQRPLLLILLLYYIYKIAQWMWCTVHASKNVFVARIKIINSKYIWSCAFYFVCYMHGWRLTLYD